MAEDLTGKIFGRLKVIRRIENAKQPLWLCECVCGNNTAVTTDHLVSGHTKSCGCYKRETARRKNGIPHKRLSRIYWAMKERCHKTYSLAYKNYGARGISVCDEWRDEKIGHDNFIRWALGNGYRDDLTLDRIDVNGDYSPANCRWCTKKQQARNTRANRIVVFEGVEMCIAEAAERSGINESTIRSRLRYGWDHTRLFNPVKNMEEDI